MAQEGEGLAGEGTCSPPGVVRKEELDGATDAKLDATRVQLMPDQRPGLGHREGDACHVDYSPQRLVVGNSVPPSGDTGDGIAFHNEGSGEQAREREGGGQT